MLSTFCRRGEINIMSKLKFCEHCGETGDNLINFQKLIESIRIGNPKECLKGYLFFDKIDDMSMVCPHCGNNLIDTELSVSEFCNILLYTDNNPKVVHALIDLYKNDPIEYQIKINQLKVQYEQQKVAKKQQRNQQQSQPSRQNDPKLTCPKCGSTNITEGTKGFSLTTGFIGSGNFRYVCKNCGNKWKPGSVLEALQRANNGN